MKAYEINREFGIDSLSLSERPVPIPIDNEVLVKLNSISLNYRDLLIVRGQLKLVKPLPLVPFSDGAGEVVATGRAVSRFKTGDRVACNFFQSWLEGPISPGKFSTALGGALDGVGVEFIKLHEHGLVTIPDHLSFDEAATLPCAAVTAWNAMVCQGQTRAGHTVLIQGTGGVSIFAIQFAKILGIRIILISSSDEKLARAKTTLGVQHVINYKSEPNWDERVREITAGEGVDHVIEVGGAGTLNKSIRATRMGGVISLIGVLTGETAQINTAAILRKSIRVQGIYVGSREMFHAMNGAIACNKMRPVVDRVFPFADAGSALRYMETGSHFGKICLRF